MAIELGEHQMNALEQLENGKILCGGVGSGKSRVAIAWAYLKVMGAVIPINDSCEIEEQPPKNPKDVYIITTARKRDSLDWEEEMILFGIYKDAQYNPGGFKIVVDSWNNIQKYKQVTDAIFIFDEQRLVGTGAWVKSFLNIARHGNTWILLSATPGDTWLDYAPVLIANGFYRNISDFREQHVVYEYRNNYPKVKRYIVQGKLVKYRNRLLVDMPLERHTTRHEIIEAVAYDRNWWDMITKKKWNIYENAPIKDAGELFRCMRRVVNTDPSRLMKVGEILIKHPRLIIFYNFDYELELLRKLQQAFDIPFAEWNGHKHEPVPEADSWVYLVQYTAGAEAWNCITTDTVVFFSLNYSYKIFEQSKGRTDRMNTPFTDLYYHVLKSSAPIDVAIWKAIGNKETFNESGWWGKSD